MSSIKNIGEQDLSILRYLGRTRIGWIARFEILDPYGDGSGN